MRKSIHEHVKMALMPSAVNEGRDQPTRTCSLIWAFFVDHRILIYCRIYGRTKKALITKTCLYNLDPLKPHFYIVKLGLQGYTLFFLFLLKKIDCGYSLEPPQRGGSNEYPQFMLLAEIRKISEFLSENFQFFMVKFSVYLNRHVFVKLIKLCGCAD